MYIVVVVVVVVASFDNYLFPVAFRALFTRPYDFAVVWDCPHGLVGATERTANSVLFGHSFATTVGTNRQT